MNVCCVVRNLLTKNVYLQTRHPSVRARFSLTEQSFIVIGGIFRETGQYGGEKNKKQNYFSILINIDIYHNTSCNNYTLSGDVKDLFAVLVDIDRLSEIILLCALLLLRYPTTFLYFVSSALEDNISSLSALKHKVYLCKTNWLTIKRG